MPEPRGVNFGSGSQCVRGLSAEIYAAQPHATIFKVIGAAISTLCVIIILGGSKCAEKSSAPPGAAENEIEQF